MKYGVAQRTKQDQHGPYSIMLSTLLNVDEGAMNNNLSWAMIKNDLWVMAVGRHHTKTPA